MKKTGIRFSDERLITPSGLSLVGSILGKSDFVKRCNRMSVTDRGSQPQIKNSDILLTYIGLPCQGKPAFENVKKILEDPDYYKSALGISYAIPSAEMLRQRMDSIGSSLRKEILDAYVNMLKAHHFLPTPLKNGFVPLDMDVTPMDNSKSSKGT